MVDPVASDTHAQRSAALWSWFLDLCSSNGLGEPVGSIQPVSGDASFRRYFRGLAGTQSWILVDAPPDKEDSRPFLSVQTTLHAAGVRVPAVLAADTTLGFMCLEDFGSDLLWPALEQARLQGDTRHAGRLYRSAMDELLKIQRCSAVQPALPAYDAALLQREVLLFRDWLCEGILGLRPNAAEQQLLQSCFDTLIQAALAQPRVYVHRDYHSRNLMLTPQGLGVIDFQDAVYGPCTYDLVSLLKDCYIAWPADAVAAWALEYLARARDAGIVQGMGDAAFLQAFHLMGVQRHLKAAGIFCRLWLRDGKPGYLQEIPRTLGYITALPQTTGVIAEFSDWLRLRVLPVLEPCLLAALEPGAARSGHA